MKSWEVNRRTVLGGAGTAIALPFLEAMLPDWKRARAAGAQAPKRLLIYLFTYGTPDIYYMRPGSWKPDGEGSNFTLSPILQPLAAFKKDILVIGGLNNDIGRDADSPEDMRIGDHEGATMSILTAVHVDKKKVAGISVDQVAANAFKQYTPSLPSMYLNSMYQSEYGEEVCWLSWTAPTSPRKMIVKSTEAFSQVFGNPGADAAALKKLQASKQSVLHHAKADADRLRAKLGKADQQMLDQYLTSVGALEQRISAPLPVQPMGMCAPTAAPTDDGTEEALSRQKRTKDMLDLLVLSLQCDRTRVGLFVPGHEHDFRQPWLGDQYAKYTWHLDISHAITQTTDKAEQAIRLDAYVKGVAWYMEQFAYLLKKLKETPEGDGSGSSLLDNTLLLVTSEMHAGDGHPVDEVPVLVAGGGGGSAVSLGRHIEVKSQPVANLYVSILNALGITTTKFGNSTGPLSLT